MRLFPGCLWRIRWVVLFGLFLLMLPGQAEAGEDYPVGYCTCTGGNCSRWNGTGWDGVASCGGSSSTTVSGNSGRNLVSIDNANRMTSEFSGNYGRFQYVNGTVRQGCGTSSVTTSTTYAYKPPVANAALPESGLGVAAIGSRTEFTSTSEIDGTKRDASVGGLDFFYAGDLGKWQYVVSLPVKSQKNNGVFDAFDNTSIGIKFRPEYRLLLQQVHGVSFNIGAVVGYDYYRYDNKSKLTDPNGRFAVSGFDDPSSFQVGPLARLSWTMGGTSLSGFVSHIYFRNLSNTNLYGEDASLTVAGAGIEQVIWKGGLVGYNLNFNRLHHIDTADPEYLEGYLYIRQIFARKSSLSLGISQTDGNSDYKTTGLTLMYAIELD